MDMLADLNIYAAFKNRSNIPFNPDDFDNPEDAKAALLDAYQELLHDDLHAQLDYLRAAQPASAKEAGDIETIQNYILTCPNIFSQNCEVAHITASGLLIDVEHNKILLHKHKKLGIWIQFGGHMDFELRVAEAATREMIEESGLANVTLVSYFPDLNIPVDIDVHTIPAKNDRGEHKHLDFRFLFTTSTPDAVNPGQDESPEYEWFTVQEILDSPNDVISTDVKRLAQKAQRYFDCLERK